MVHTSPSSLSRARLYKRIDQTADTDRSQPLMTLAVGGSLLKVQYAKIPTGPRTHSRRGAVLAFTRQSRGRLFELLASLNQAALKQLPLFLTLTYPKVFPTDRVTTKRHLDSWLKRLRRVYPKCAVIWKLEYQRRGAPHFHILLFHVKWVDRRLLSRTWYEVVNSRDERHLKAGTRIEFIRSWRGVMHYASKYVGKVVALPAGADPGRFWGVSGRGYLPITLAVAALTFQGFYRARRALASYYQAAARSALQRSSAAPAGKTSTTRSWLIRRTSGVQGFKLFLDYKKLVGLMRCFE